MPSWEMFAVALQWGDVLFSYLDMYALNIDLTHPNLPRPLSVLTTNLDLSLFVCVQMQEQK